MDTAGASKRTSHSAISNLRTRYRMPIFGGSALPASRGSMRAPRLKVTVVSAATFTENKRAEARNRELVEYDFLTGSPNRMLLSTRFTFATRKTRRGGSGISLLFIDLDRYKNINNSIGHHIDDQILVETAHRLVWAMRVSASVSRHGGAEFIVWVPGVAVIKDLAAITEIVFQSLGSLYQIAGFDLTVTPFIGITSWPGDGVDLASLVKNADPAMYHSKADGGNQSGFFDAEMNKKVVERLANKTSLRSVLPRNEFSLAYQPIFHCPGGESSV